MKYAYPTYAENMARAQGKDLSISMKQSMMITQFIRNKEVDKAKAALERVIEKKTAIPFTKFQNGLGHKPGMGPGRYPIKACKEILAVLTAAQANAQNKGLGRCVIVHAAAQEARQPYHAGRRRRIKMRRAHIQIVLKESEATPKDRQSKGQKTTSLPATLDVDHSRLNTVQSVKNEKPSTKNNQRKSKNEEQSTKKQERRTTNDQQPTTSA